MLESAQNLLLASKDEVKVQKLQEAVKTHQSNLDRIQEQLEEAKSKKKSQGITPLIIVSAPTHNLEYYNVHNKMNMYGNEATVRSCLCIYTNTLEAITVAAAFGTYTWNVGCLRAKYMCMHFNHLMASSRYVYLHGAQLRYLHAI